MSGIAEYCPPAAKWNTEHYFTDPPPHPQFVAFSACLWHCQSECQWRPSLMADFKCSSAFSPLNLPFWCWFKFNFLSLLNALLPRASHCPSRIALTSLQVSLLNFPKVLFAHLKPTLQLFLEESNELKTTLPSPSLVPASTVINMYNYFSILFNNSLMKKWVE